MEKREMKNHKRNITIEEINPAIKREISASGDHNSNNNNRKNKTFITETKKKQHPPPPHTHTHTPVYSTLRGT